MDYLINNFPIDEKYPLIGEHRFLYSVLPIAVTVGKTCIVLIDLVEEEAFSPIKDHLVKKEAFDQSFLYYNMIDGFQPAFFDVKVYDSRSFMTKMDYLINSFLIDEKYPFYRRTSFPVISASPFTSRSLLIFDKDSNYFYFSYYDEENNLIKVLVSRYSVLPIAVTVGKTCIVLVDLVEEEAFSHTKDHLVKKEAFDHSFLYYNMIDGFQPEEVPYSRGHLISDVDSLLKINPRNIESPDHSVIFNRILGRLWVFNLAEARVSYSVLRRLEAPSTVTPALPLKLAESIFQDSSTSDVPRVSFTPAVSRVSSTSVVP
ncbi:hypothetical protein POM88_051009 [Heracleum sosnowskyi]|uniref:Uncharacterized protein n=1 Tax=Heracleum sosnowskyi TaxID=360622 RepID=A0AAD8M3B5_9APIA|nr:hypothetical protein POM88_051009 [Heracleum sosnowskyi]